MKNNLLFVAMLTGMSFAQAQITLTSADVQGPGDVITTSYDSIPAGFSVGTGGPNQSWDFSGLLPLEFYTNAMVPIDQAPLVNEFPAANRCLLADGVFNYFNLTDTKLEVLGAATNLFDSENLTALKLNPTQTAMVFPATYGTNFATDYGLALVLDGSDLGVDSIRIKQTIHENLNFDSYGVVVLPNGVFDALRIRREINSVDSIFVKFLGFWQLADAQETQSVTYDWYSHESKGLLVSVALDETGAPSNATHFISLNAAVVAPVADFDFENTEAGTIVFTDASGNAPTDWTWTFGDGNTSTEQNPTHTYAESGDYEVCLTVSNSAGESTFCQTISIVITGTDEPFAGLISAFPNPVVDALTIRFDQQITAQSEVALFNEAGQAVMRQTLDQTTRIPMNNYPSGIYFYQIRQTDGKLIAGGKIVKQ